MPALKKKQLHLSEIKPRTLTLRVSEEKGPWILLRKEKCKRKEGLHLPHFRTGQDDSLSNKSYFTDCWVKCFVNCYFASIYGRDGTVVNIIIISIMVGITVTCAIKTHPVQFPLSHPRPYSLDLSGPQAQAPSSPSFGPSRKGP